MAILMFTSFGNLYYSSSDAHTEHILTLVGSWIHIQLRRTHPPAAVSGLEDLFAGHGLHYHSTLQEYLVVHLACLIDARRYNRVDEGLSRVNSG